MNTYLEMAEVLSNLPLLLREARRSRDLSSRQAAAQIGISHSTVCRMELGKDESLSTALAVLRWL